jgi:uncharacterized damage-inducible protein DinB
MLNTIHNHFVSPEATAMKVLLGLMMAGLAAAPALHAQAPAAAPAATMPNPIVWSAKEMYSRSEKNILASADEMPADKYSFHPTDGQKSFGWIVSHLAQSNGGLCAILSDGAAPATTKVAETATKDELTAALKASFDYCDGVMAALTDAKLTDTVTFFRGAKVPRARALFEITGDLMDHYSQMAGYLRAAGMLPPSAQPPKK